MTHPLRVVVLGLGMVGARLVDELERRDLDGALDVTVLGAEPHEPYNRVLLSDVVAGRTGADAIAMPLPAGRATVRRGVAAVAIDREARTVLADDGTTHPYDRLVLATGATGRILPLPGLDPLPRGVHPLRTLDDAHAILDAVAAARDPQAVVIGGGVLGIEVALGLAARGARTAVVHDMPTVLDRQLDAEAGAVLAGTLAARGVRAVTGARVQEVEVADGAATGVRLATGETLAADLVVLAAGAVPDTRLAAAAGLRVERGVVVGADLASPDDPHVFAIGDCAQPPEGSHGLVAEGWDQARRLAQALCAAGQADVAAAPRVEAAGTDVVKVKAGDLSVVAMGACGAGRTPGAGERAVRLSDPAGGRWVEAVVADGVLVGATCVGDARVAADLTVAYTRRTPVPADPAFLLLTPLAPAAAPVTSPEQMPDDAVVCRCNAVTKADLAKAVDNGAATPADLAAATRATTGCGSCAADVEGLCGWLTGVRG